VTELGIQGLLPAQLVLDLATVTAGFVANAEIRVVFVHLVGCSEFPLIELALCATVVSICIVTILGRVLGASVHLPCGCM